MEGRGGDRMTSVRDLANIGSVVAAELESVGIETAEELRALGSVRAGIVLKANHFHVCASKLYGLEGAIRGVRWHDIPEDQRRRLRRELEGFGGDSQG